MMRMTEAQGRSFASFSRSASLPGARLCKVKIIRSGCTKHHRRTLIFLCRNKFGRAARIEVIPNSKAGFVNPAEAEGFITRLKEHYKFPEFEEGTKWWAKCYECCEYPLQWPESWSSDVVRQVESMTHRDEDGQLNKNEMDRLREIIRIGQCPDNHHPWQRGVEYWEVDGIPRGQSEEAP
ncbi:uncharacterized protein EI97DRAFT_438477 [Westerdykella ornata]|uniref:Uncharacterized protein n=1 Tax=Westerdykella ornata TaxID=318751 RepID=A0A6A6JZ87_WESOR|nr:uncharacterized protein EI97DRAFT_438477 [Westerdykella ornata]KAF2281076.1 hypothetical protein EI97DRAFT_438477 [Westerdykella ornata]